MPVLEGASPAHRALSPPRVVRLYQRAAVVRARVGRLSEALLDGAFLGLMDRDALAALDTWFYARAREAVDGVPRGYADEEHIRSGLHGWERAALRDAFPAGGRIIVTGAGAGREVLGLIQEGFDPRGYEPNSHLVAAGARLLAHCGHPDRLQTCSRDAFPAQAGRADGIVVGWGSYMLIPGRERRIAFLAGARERLETGAPLLLSFFVRPPGRYLSVVHAVATGVCRLGGRGAPEPGDALSPNFVHYFTREEIVDELSAAGFACRVHRAEPYAHALASAT